MAKDLYTILGVPRTATPEQIRQRFRELARTCHPDRFQGEARLRAEEEFQQVTEAFNVLSSPERRRQLDLELARPEASSSAGDAQKLARLHLQAGIRFYRERNFIQAAESFDRATKADPQSAQAWHHLAQACSHHRRYLSQGLAAVVRACELDGMNPVYLKLAGKLHATAGLFDRAEWYYNQALVWGGEDDAVRSALEELSRTSRKGGSGLFGKGG
ncbi:MAG: DnaJ domain-containing protein [Thermoanaerobaculia bacterium]|nr:DnaJ domain-containing protein [Thermoanaerobaculia bacterium]